MVRSIVAISLLAAAGVAHAGPFSRIQPSVNTFLAGSNQFPGGMGEASNQFLGGHITEGFRAGRNGFTGLAVGLTDGTGLDFIGTAAERTHIGIFNTLLPLYMALDGPAEAFAAPGAPVTEPLGSFIVRISRLPALPGLE